MEVTKTTKKRNQTQMKKNNKTVIFCFGGFRIFTQAHYDLLLTVFAKQQSLKCDCNVWVSSSKGKYLALSPKQKLFHINSLLLKHEQKCVALTDKNTKYPNQVVQRYVEMGYEKIIFVGGSDRDAMAKDMENQIINSGKQIDFEFACIERTSDVSATAMKEAVYANDMDLFLSICPSDMMYWQKIAMFGEVAIGLGHWTKKPQLFRKKVRVFRENKILAHHKPDVKSILRIGSMVDAVRACEEKVFFDLCSSEMPDWKKLKLYGDTAINLGLWKRRSPHFNKRINNLKQKEKENEKNSL